MKSNYTPLEDRVVISVPKEEETINSSGLIIPIDASKSPLKEVIVEAVGDGHRVNGQVIKMVVRVGQKVVIGVNTGVEYDYEGKTYRIIRQDDVQFIVE